MATEIVTADPRRYTEGETGVIEGLTAMERVNRVHFMLDGLSALQVIFDSAHHAPEENQSNHISWEPVLYMTRMLLDDIHSEVSAIHHQMAAERGA